MARTFRVVFKTILYNGVVIEAENKEQAEELANEEIGEIDLYEGEVSEQEIVEIKPID